MSYSVDLDQQFENAKSFDVSNATLEELEAEAKLVDSYLKSVYDETKAIDNYKTIHNFFKKQAVQHSSEPYQDVCDNYYVFKRMLKEYEPKKVKGEVDYLHMAHDVILAHLETGTNRCCSWLHEDFYDHYSTVNTCMNYWKDTLIEKGYAF